MSLHYCIVLLNNNRRIPPSSSGFAPGKRLTLLLSESFMKASSGSDTAQQCVALPKVGVLKSQIICFLKQCDSVAFHSAQLSHALNEEREIAWIRHFCVESQNFTALQSLHSCRFSVYCADLFWTWWSLAFWAKIILTRYWSQTSMKIEAKLFS